MILTGRRVDAEEGMRSGLITRLVSADELLPRAIEAAAQLAALDAAALRFAKCGLRTMGNRTIEDDLQFEAHACLSLLTRASRRP
jgi:enoyl-CoA hydratase